MKSAEVIGAERRKAPVVSLETDTQFVAYKNELFRAISDRAYALFERRQGKHGSDVGDWMNAEAELLRPMPCELAHKGNELMLRAEVPGFNERELRIGTASRQIWISGHKERIASAPQDVIFNELQSKDVFRIIDLPLEIDPQKASVMLHRGILTIFIATSSMTQPVAELQAAGQAA